MFVNRFVISDHHLGHANIIDYCDRPFKSVEEMHEYMIMKHNSVVKPTDQTYFLGDVAFHNKTLPLLNRFNGKKVLIKGNHDKLTLREYMKYFKDVRGSHLIDGVLLTHIPVHPCELEHRFKLNAHGHMHNSFVDDIKYFNCCVEKLDYTPISIDELKEKFLDEVCNSKTS
jgi:calcineurin-like phosphoesterase family protein